MSAGQVELALEAVEFREQVILWLAISAGCVPVNFWPFRGSRYERMLHRLWNGLSQNEAWQDRGIAERVTRTHSDERPLESFRTGRFSKAAQPTRL
jgi:hypothetical protein